MKQQVILITGGGTGGHVYPGIAVARALLENNPNYQIHFVGGTRGIENKIVPRENFVLHTLNIGALNQVSKKEKLLTLLQLPIAVCKSIWLLLQLRPIYVIGFGGYASGPLLIAAVLCRWIINYKIGIWEGNAIPGLVNRWIGQFVDHGFFVFDKTKELLATHKQYVFGLPVRANMLPKTRETSHKFRVLIFGGSQGARAINNVVSDAIIQEAQKFSELKGSVLEDVQIVHQTGSADFEKIKNKYSAVSLAPETLEIKEFLYDMNDRMNWADLLFCRGGVGTVGEICSVGKAAVIIPLPTAADNHQQKNAEVLVNANAGLMILQKEFTIDKFLSTLRELKQSREKLALIEQNAKKLDKPQAAAKIASVIEGNFVE